MVGIKSNELRILISTCNPKQQIKPIIAIIIYGLLILSNLRRVRIIIIKNNKTIKLQTIKPNSSPATAKIKSVCASGSLSFSSPWPGPFPNNPPDLKEFNDVCEEC